MFDAARDALFGGSKAGSSEPTAYDANSDYESAAASATPVSEFDWTFVPPEESGIPPSSGEHDPYLDMGYDLGIADDSYAMDALWTGWYDLDADSDERVAAREAFFDYLDWDEYEFDWDDWRDWYESV